MNKVEIVTFQAPYEEDIRHIRHTVFTLEQNVDPEIEFDDQDESAVHVLIHVDGQPAATGRMLEDGHIGRVAVLAPFRKQGIGKQVLSALEQHAASQEMNKVYLGAQLHASGFYKNLGYQPYGSEYIEANIRHISMEKSL